MDGTEMKKKPRQLSLTNNDGFSLVEVLVAAIVLAVGLLGVAVMQYTAIAGNAFGREMQMASEAAQEKLEVFRSAAYASVMSGDESLSDPSASRFGGLTFTRRWWVKDDCRDIDVEYKPENPCDPESKVNCTDSLTDVKAVAVRVCWVDKNGGNHSITLNSLKWNEAAAP